MNEFTQCLLGFISAFIFILLFLLAWRFANPRGEPNIVERVGAAVMQFKAARTRGQRFVAYLLFVPLILKSSKGLIIGFFGLTLTLVGAAFCGIDLFEIINRLIDIFENRTSAA